ncbi:Myb-like DNA-binding domain protein [Kappamyces sp. JEL0829]|nr:Myb-like DNA-binding domain protein [Kappamyces sp. JEL0829]
MHQQQAEREQEAGQIQEKITEILGALDAVKRKKEQNQDELLRLRHLIRERKSELDDSSMAVQVIKCRPFLKVRKPGIHQTAKAPLGASLGVYSKADLILGAGQCRTNLFILGNTQDTAQLRQVVESMIQSTGLYDPVTHRRPIEQFKESHWMRIKRHFRNRSIFECKQYYTTHANPLLNTASYSPEELARLKDTVERLAGKDWTAIAAAHGNARNAISCFKAYKTLIQTTERTGSWTQREDEQLALGKQMYGTDWKAVATVVPGRSSEQCRNRNLVTGTADKRRGRWTEAEDQQLLDIVKSLGPDFSWSQVAVHLKGRSELQCRERWVHHHNQDIDKSPFSQEDRTRLAELVGRLGAGRWAEIATHFPTRDRTQVRRTWLSIQRIGVNGKPRKEAAATGAQNGKTRAGEPSGTPAPARRSGAAEGSPSPERHRRKSARLQGRGRHS